MNILLFAGSLRQKSWNRKYVKVAQSILQTLPGVNAEFVDLNDYPLPVYNQDIEDREFPAAAAELAKKVKAVEGLVISSPSGVTPKPCQ